MSNTGKMDSDTSTRSSASLELFAQPKPLTGGENTDKEG